MGPRQKLHLREDFPIKFPSRLLDCMEAKTNEKPDGTTYSNASVLVVQSSEAPGTTPAQSRAPRALGSGTAWSFGSGSLGTLGTSSTSSSAFTMADCAKGLLQRMERDSVKLRSDAILKYLSLARDGKLVLKEPAEKATKGRRAGAAAEERVGGQGGAAGMSQSADKTVAVGRTSVPGYKKAFKHAAGVADAFADVLLFGGKMPPSPSGGVVDRMKSIGGTCCQVNPYASPSSGGEPEQCEVGEKSAGHPHPRDSPSEQHTKGGASSYAVRKENLYAAFSPSSGGEQGGEKAKAGMRGGARGAGASSCVPGMVNPYGPFAEQGAEEKGRKKERCKIQEIS